MTMSDDFDDTILSTSPPRLTPIRTPSASDRNRGLRIPTTINESSKPGVGYVLNLGEFIGHRTRDVSLQQATLANQLLLWPSLLFGIIAQT